MWRAILSVFACKYEYKCLEKYWSRGGEMSDRRFGAKDEGVKGDMLETGGRAARPDRTGFGNKSNI
jgi:hypothetical protein